jgi:hypothetical protein
LNEVLSVVAIPAQGYRESARSFGIAASIASRLDASTIMIFAFDSRFLRDAATVLLSCHEPGGGANTQRRVWSGLRQIQTFPSGLGVASSNGTNSVPPGS